MYLTTATDFELAFYLLGCYEQEVKKTGMIQYPLHYERDLQLPIDPEEEPSSPPKRDTWANNFELSCDLPTPVHQNVPELAPRSILSSVSQTHPAVVEVNRPTPAVIIEVDTPPRGIVVPTTTGMTSGTEEIQKSLPSLSREEQLLQYQEEERRLFYLYAQELETSGDLTKLPQVLRR